VDSVGPADAGRQEGAAPHALPLAIADADAWLWRGLIGLLPDYAWLKGADGRYLECNELFARHFGRERAAIVGLRDADITDAETAAAFVASDREAMALPPGLPLRREERMRLPDGRVDTFELTKLALRGADGQPSAVVGLGRAIGEAQRAQRLREQYAERLELALDGAELAQWDFDVQADRVVSVNERTAAMLGRRVDEMPLDRRGWDALMHPDDIAGRDAARHAHLHGGAARYECEYRMRHAQGWWVWMLSRAKVVERAADGTPLRMVGTLMDISWRKAAQAQAQAAATTMQLAQAQSELLSRMSHELLTPLNAVLGFTQLMRLAQAQGQPVRTDYLALVDDGGRQLLALIEGALALRAAGADAARLVPQALALGPAIDEAQALLLPQWQGHAVQWINEVGADSRRVWCDPAALRQALVNVASNAIRFNRSGGDVRWRVGESRRTGFVELHLLDQGEGMNPDELARLFRPFERLGRLPGTQAGSGLGLMTARALLRSMGGELWLTSQKGVGTCAVLELPAAP
jgi:PAS domain S-box-containing protein